MTLSSAISLTPRDFMLGDQPPCHCCLMSRERTCLEEGGLRQMGVSRWLIEAHVAASHIKHCDLDPVTAAHILTCTSLQCSDSLLREDLLPPAASWTHHSLWCCPLLRRTFGCSKTFPDFSPCSDLVGWGLWTRKEGICVHSCLYFLN